MVSAAACASWYWPFGGSEDGTKPPRISELLEEATEMIDRAAEYSDEGKIDEAVAEYRRALVELDRVEYMNPARAETAEFTTVRNKRAYVNAAIDSLLLKQAQQNAKAVAVTDTTELQKRYDRLKGKSIPDEKKMEIAEKKVGEIEAQNVAAEAGRAARAAAEAPQTAETPRTEEPAGPDAAVLQEIAALLAKDPKSRRARLMMAAADLRAKDFEAAKLTLKGLLDERPNDAAALNMRAAVETEMGDYKAAERTLDQSIQSNPRSYYAYYNMAYLFLQTRGAEGKTAAQRYYDTGRAVGGPEDKKLEAGLKR